VLRALLGAIFSFIKEQISWELTWLHSPLRESEKSLLTSHNKIIYPFYNKKRINLLLGK
jgi:hypothetical protein